MLAFALIFLKNSVALYGHSTLQGQVALSPGGVLRISSDGDDRMGGKNQDPKKSLGFPT